MRVLLLGRTTKGFLRSRGIGFCFIFSGPEPRLPSLKARGARSCMAFGAVRHRLLYVVTVIALELLMLSIRDPRWASSSEGLIGSRGGM